jgi:hypothetical protein
MTEDIKTLSNMIHTRTGGHVGVTTYSPGDGETRYALGTSDFNAGYLHNYFSDHRIMSCRGAKAARTMLTGFLAGIDYARNND